MKDRALKLFSDYNDAIGTWSEHGGCRSTHSTYGRMA